MRRRLGCRFPFSKAPPFLQLVFSVSNNGGANCGEKSFQRDLVNGTTCNETFFLHSCQKHEKHILFAAQFSAIRTPVSYKTCIITDIYETTSSFAQKSWVKEQPQDIVIYISRNFISSSYDLQ